MNKQNIMAWFFEGGTVGVPKHLLGLMDPLGLNFDDLGKILYLLYCGTDQILPTDQYAIQAAKGLHAKGVLHWYVNENRIDFTPMFDKIAESLGDSPVYTTLSQPQTETDIMTYATMIKKLERSLGRFPTVREKQELEVVAQQYQWDYAFVYELFLEYDKNFKRRYAWKSFCQITFAAGVQDSTGIRELVLRMDSQMQKTIDVLRRLGKQNAPTEAQKEMYHKWANIWKFTHEMILLAADETITADRPNMKYMESVLKSWMDHQIMTPEALAQWKNQREREQQSKSAQKKTGTVRNGSAHNFEHTKTDYGRFIE